MEAHYNIPDPEFQEAFEHCRLAPSLFTHEAHLRMAWLYLKQCGLEGALDKFPRDLKAYVKSLGASEKYHETLTQAALRAVYHFMQRSEARAFSGFISEFPRLNSHFRELMATHYGWETLHGKAARNTYLEPDLLPFT